MSRCTAATYLPVSSMEKNKQFIAVAEIGDRLESAWRFELDGSTQRITNR